MNSHVGMRVLVRSNEDEPLKEGVIVRFDDMGGKAKPPITVFRDDSGREWCCMSIVLEDTPENRAGLEGLTPKEQWEKFKRKGLKPHG